MACKFNRIYYKLLEFFERCFWYGIEEFYLEMEGQDLGTQMSAQSQKKTNFLLYVYETACQLKVDRTVYEIRVVS